MKQGLGLAIGATLMDLKRATTLASVTVMTFMLAGGFFVKVNFNYLIDIHIVDVNFVHYQLIIIVKS